MDALRTYIAAVAEGGQLPTEGQWRSIVRLAGDPVPPTSPAPRADATGYAAWLRGELEKPGRSQTALARHLGVDQSAVSRMCRGERAVKVDEAAMIDAYLAGQTVTQAGDHVKDEAIGIIRSLMDEKGWSATKVARAAGLTASTVTRALDESFAFIPSGRTLQKLRAVRNMEPTQ